MFTPIYNIAARCFRSVPVVFAALGCLAFSAMAQDHDHGSDHDHGQTQDNAKHEHSAKDAESHHDQTHISAAMAESNGIVSRSAGPGTVERHVQVFGTLVTPPAKRAQVRARFPGLIKDIPVGIGDSVKRGQTLAVIESNDSLQDYQLRAPIDAVVQSRAANAGEVTGPDALFTLVNTDTLWAELQVFPAQRFEVKPGLPVHVEHNDHRHEGKISHITPSSSDQPYVIARVELANSHQDMAPGDRVSGQIDAQILNAEVVVETRALQEFEGITVVFVRTGDNTYAPRAITLGVSDGQHVEVLEGLSPGETYVAQNSYLIKADLKKSGAAHSH